MILYKYYKSVIIKYILDITIKNININLQIM